jgi:hypothetical protein
MAGRADTAERSNDMAELVHPRGNLKMSIEGMDVDGQTMCVNGKMGVWTAQIRLSPREVIALFGLLLQPRVILYVLSLPVMLVRARGENE